MFQSTISYVRSIESMSSDIALQVSVNHKPAFLEPPVTILKGRDDVDELLSKCYRKIRELASSELSFGIGTASKEACDIISGFGIELMNSELLSNLTKIALFHKLNIVGCNFDRSCGNYNQNQKTLENFLNELEKFRTRLKPDELELWNASTYKGNEQVSVFRNWLEYSAANPDQFKP